jgi:CDP-diacylglycerol--glycerol-3-phosphate 3-phosphatidyltransferase
MVKGHGPADKQRFGEAGSMASITPTETGIFNLPNQLTAARLVLAIILFVLIAFEQWLAGMVVFAAAAFTDWLDGFIARRWGISNALGRNLDPLVDKVLICGAYVFLLPVEGAGLAAWMVTLVVARELIITSLRSFMEQQGAAFGADWLGKIKMVLQCAALFGIFVSLEARGETYLVIRDVLTYGMIVATALSGLQYLWRAAQVLRTG